MTPEQILEESEKLQDKLIFNRRYLHSHAETGFDLKDTFAFVKKELKELGYEPAECGKADLIALARGKEMERAFLSGATWMYYQLRNEQMLISLL